MGKQSRNRIDQLAHIKAGITVDETERCDRGKYEKGGQEEEDRDGKPARTQAANDRRKRGMIK